jgi:hypothetical protein
MKLQLFYADERLDKYNILGWLQLLIAGGLLFLLLYSLQFGTQIRFSSLGPSTGQSRARL